MGETRRWTAVLVTLPLLALLAVGCDAGLEPALALPGLQPEETVDLTWPERREEARVRYYNVIANGASWLEANGNPVYEPRAVALDEAADRTYLSTSIGVLAIDNATGQMTRFAESIQDAQGIDVAADGTVFIIDRLARKVSTFDRSGTYLFDLGGEDVFTRPLALAIDSARARIFVVDAGANQVSAWSLTGNRLFDLDYSLTMPVDVAVNSKGQIYVAHWGAPHVVVFDEAGRFERAFASHGTSWGSLWRPKSLAFDSDDNAYVVDSAFNNFQIFTPEDKLALFVGSPGTALGQFSLPVQITIDRQDRIYVPEYGNHRVQILEYLSE